MTSCSPMAQDWRVLHLQVLRFFSVQGDPGQVAPNTGWGPMAGSGVGKGRCLGWKLHCPSFGGLGGHPVLPALSRLSREPSLSLTPTPRSCRRPHAARGRKQPTRSCPLPPPTVLGPRRVALPVWGRQLPPGRSQGVVASWLEESDLCPHRPPPSRNCLHHIREDRAPGREGMGEGVGRQVAAVSLGARSPVTARHPQPRGPTPGSPASTQGWDTFLPGAQMLAAGGQHLPGKVGAPGPFILPNQRSSLLRPPFSFGGVTQG